MSQITDNTEGKFELWFFRDMNDAQRLKLFSLFGLPTDEIRTLGAQKLVLRRILSALVSSPGKDGGQEVEAVAIEAAITKAMGWHPSETGPSYQQTRDEVLAALPIEGLLVENANLKDMLAGCRSELRNSVEQIAKRDVQIKDLNEMVLRYAYRAENAAALTQSESTVLEAALRKIAAEQNVYLGHGNYDTIPALTAEEAQSVARSALSTQPASTALVERAAAFDQIVAAWKAHIDAVDAYNARLEFVRAERQRGNWLTVDPEYTASTDAQKAFWKVTQELARAALASAQSTEEPRQ